MHFLYAKSNQSVLKTLVINDCKIGDENAAKSGRRLEKVLKDCDQLKAITLINLSYELSELIMAFPRLMHLRYKKLLKSPKRFIKNFRKKHHFDRSI